MALLLGAESIAQFVAWRVWRTEWIGPHGEPDAQTVLLVGAGECYDERVASREEAWPAEAVASLEGAPVRLVAGAAPGRDSEDILRRLPLQLSIERPARVVLCVDPERLTAVLNVCEAAGVATSRIGVAGGDRFSVKGLVDVGVDDVRSAWGDRLPGALGHGTSQG